MFRPRSECIRLPQNKTNKHAEYRYTCKICEEGGWASETELEIHKSQKHFERMRKMAMQPNVCLTCVTEHKDSKSLLKHIKSEHLMSSEDSRRVEREIFVCDKCEQIFFNKNHLEIHISFKHMSMKFFKCPLCPKKVKARYLWGHFQIHQLQSVSTCSICLVKCMNRLHLKEHIDSHRKFYNCHVCNYRTNSGKNFELHRCCARSEDNNILDYKKFFVKPKDKTRWAHSVVKNPVKGLSLWNKVFICVICREICTNNKGMREHMNKDHALGELVTRKRHICLCGEEFCNRLLLKHHVFKKKRSHRVLQEGEEPNGSLADFEELIVLDDSDDASFPEQSQDVLITDQTQVVVLTDQSQDVPCTEQRKNVLITEQTQLVLLTEETQDVPFSGQTEVNTGVPQDPLHIRETPDFLITEQTQDVLPTEQTQPVLTGHNQNIVQTGQDQYVLLSDQTQDVPYTEHDQGVLHTDHTQAVLQTGNDQDVLHTDQTQHVLKTGHDQDVLHTEQTENTDFSDNSVITTEITFPNTTRTDNITNNEFLMIRRNGRAMKLNAKSRTRPRRRCGKLNSFI